MSNLTKIISWIAKLLAAIIMLQTLYFKFSASYESVMIFTAVGMEPYGRIAIGVLELIASVLILIPATAYLGAGLALGLMAGAIGMHLTILGIQVKGATGEYDGGQLFIYALIVALSSLYVLWVEKEKVLKLLNSLIKR